MSHTPSRWKEFRAQMRDDFVRQIADRRRAAIEQAEAIAIINLFNARLAAGLSPLAWPTVAAAIASGWHWMHVHCPGCDTIGAVDLRVVPRPPETILRDVLPKMTCRACGKAAPSPTIMDLSDRHDRS